LLLNACGWVLQIGLAWFLVPACGLAGAAWAASAGFAGILGVQLWMLRRSFGLSWRDVVPSGHYAWVVVRKIMKR
jgi:O-antigen/teichoic acid export membrane protein